MRNILIPSHTAKNCTRPLRGEKTQLQGQTELDREASWNSIGNSAESSNIKVVHLTPCFTRAYASSFADRWTCLKETWIKRSRCKNTTSNWLAMNGTTSSVNQPTTKECYMSLMPDKQCRSSHPPLPTFVKIKPLSIHEKDHRHH